MHPISVEARRLKWNAAILRYHWIAATSGNSAGNDRRQLQCVTVHRALQSSCVLACFAHQSRQNVMHFPCGAAETGFVSGPLKDRSSVIIAARQSANFIFASSARMRSPGDTMPLHPSEHGAAGVGSCAHSRVGVCWLPKVPFFLWSKTWAVKQSPGHMWRGAKGRKVRGAGGRGPRRPKRQRDKKGQGCCSHAARSTLLSWLVLSVPGYWLILRSMSV